MALKEVGTPALPQQDHVDHIQEHRVFLMSGWQQELTPQGKNVLEAHIREHLVICVHDGTAGTNADGTTTRRRRNVCWNWRDTPGRKWSNGSTTR